MLHIFSTILLLLTLSIVKANAQSGGKSVSVTPTMKSDHFDFAMQYMSYYYIEPKLMKESGNMYGFATSYNRFFQERNFKVAGEMEYLEGSLIYDGQYQNGTPARDITKDSTLSLRFLLGRNIPGNTAALLYLGVGYRNHFNRINGPGGYRRNIRYTYLPVGMSLSRNIYRNWTIKLTGEYDYFIGGKVSSYLSDVGPAWDNLDNTQDTGVGYRAKLESILHTGENISFKIGAFYRYWKIEDSDIRPVRANGKIKYMYEPENETEIIGMNIGLLY